MGVWVSGFEKMAGGRQVGGKRAKWATEAEERKRKDGNVSDKTGPHSGHGRCLSRAEGE